MSATEPQTSRALFSEHWRHDVDQMVSSNTQKDSKNLAKMVQELVYNIAQRHNNHSNQTPTLDWDLHDLWYTLIQAACICDADSADQDTLASYVIHAREFGPFARGSGRNSREAYQGTELSIHSEPQGGLEDLQYLASDLEEFWLDTSSTLPPEHLQNLSAFTARLVALGVQDKNLISCGSHLLRQTLEVPQSPSQLVGETTTSLEDLLPAVISWMSYARHKTLKLSMEKHSLSHSSAEPGNLATGAGITANSLSLARWCFWKLRLEELEKRLGGMLGSSIGQCVQAMKAAERELGVDVERCAGLDTQGR
ncbi:hypothetical protein KCU93_g5378, partial [Aureobasidium melanogenum]